MNEIDKNTVEGKNQLKDSDSVRFFGNPESKTRIMFMGNSITLHGYLPKIGWYGEWGMAASCVEKDYVHLLAEKIGDAYFCICQVADWESDYRNGENYLDAYASARDFGADIIITRFIENMDHNNVDFGLFKEKYIQLLDYVNSKSTEKIVFSTGFWKHPGDACIEQIAKERGCPLVYLGDLGDMDEMKATGLFEHDGVANHPGDKGMATVAERLWVPLKEMIG